MLWSRPDRVPSVRALPRGRADRGGPQESRSRTRRVVQFAGGLTLCAAGVWLSLQAGLGLSPWDVLHAGLGTRLALSFGTVVIGVGLVVLALSAALGVRHRVGTLVNVLLVGVSLDALLATTWLDGLSAGPVAVRVLAVIVAVLLLGVGGALYIGAGFGAGPRDSLMVACHLHGLPVGPSRCAIELTVMGTGWLLGGTVGVGTALLALGIGPVVQASFRLLRQDPASGQRGQPGP